MRPGIVRDWSLGAAVFALAFAAGVWANRRSRLETLPARPELSEVRARKAREILASALAALESEAYEEALRAADAFLAEFPSSWKSNEARRIRVAALVATGRFDLAPDPVPPPGEPEAAETWCELARARAAHDPQVEAVFAQGRRPDEPMARLDALELLERIATVRGDPARASHALYSRARLLQEKGLDREASAAYLELADRRPASRWRRQALLFAGELAVKLGDEARAADLFGQVVVEAPPHDSIWSAAWLSLAWSQARAGRKDLAVQTLESGLASNPPPDRASEAEAALVRFRRDLGTGPR